MIEFEKFRNEILAVVHSGRAATDGLVEDLFSDGHGSDPTDSEKLLASWALVRCSGRMSRVVATGAVTGSRHTVPRAELMAVVAAIPVSTALVIYTDCSYVLAGFKKLRQFCRPGVKNADLWQIIQQAVLKGWTFDLVKVKSHMNPDEATCEEDYFRWTGNGLADVKAGEAEGLATPSRTIDCSDESAASLAELLSFFAECTQKAAESREKPVHTGSVSMSLNGWGRDFTHAHQIVASTLNDSVDEGHPLKLHSFCEVWTGWFNSLRWPDQCETSPHGVTFFELGIAFLVDTGTLFPQKVARKWVQSEGHVSKVSLQTIAMITAKCVEAALLDVQPRPSVDQVSSLRFAGYRGPHSDKIRGLTSRPHLYSYSDVVRIIRQVIHESQGSPLRRVCEFSVLPGGP